MLTRYEKFIIMLQAKNIEAARKICGNDLVLKQALLLITSNYYFKWDQ